MEVAPVATEADVQQLFDSLRPRIDEITKRDVPHRTGGNLGCLLMVLPFAAAIGVLMGLQEPKLAEALWGWPLLVAPVIGVVLFYVGFKIWRPWATIGGVQREEADTVLRQPLATLLLPGATFTRDRLTVSGWHPSLLLSNPRGSHSLPCGRIAGLLLSQPVQIDELQGSFDADVPNCWLVRVELPFVVGGHLRIHRRTMMTPGVFWRDGFERLEDDSRRLGRGWNVELAPLGVGTDEGVAEPPPGSVPPGTLLTAGLFGILRDREDVQIAATGRTLWILVERTLVAFVFQVPDLDDGHRWKKAAPAMQDVELVTHEVLAAAGGRG
jgi:hypothetical protein